jgi:phosphatidylserine decarboxylase
MKSLAERLFVQSVSFPVMSRGMARIADWRMPRPMLQRLLRSYIRFYGVDMSEVAEPLDAFPTFNHFFTRLLRPGTRPVAAEDGVVVAPCDSRLHTLGAVPADGRIDQVKGRTYPVKALLGSEEDAAPFVTGVHATLYLSPSMYHRVHSPVDGTIRSWRYIPGRLFPVNALAVRHVEGVFTRNERVSVLIDSREFGPVAVVLVGAANVGRISLAFDQGPMTNTGGALRVVRPTTPIPIQRGDELGAFNLGSTVVLLAADASLQPAGVVPGEILKMGQPFWRRA